MDILTFNAVRQAQNQLAKDLLDPWKKPAFAVVSMIGTSPWGTLVYNHYLQEVARQSYNSSGAMQGTTNGEGTEFFNTWSQYGSTGSYASSNDANYGDGTSRCGHLGHMALAVAPDGAMIGRSGDYAATALRNVGVWVNNRTNRNLALFLQNQYASIAPRAIPPGRMMSSEGWHMAWTGDKFHNQNNFSANNKYGTIGYNEATRTLVVNENRGGTAMRLHVYSGVVPIDPASASRGTWFSGLQEAGHTFHDWVAQAAGTAESQSRGVVIPCDDGRIVIVRMEPNAYAMLDRFTPTGQGGFTKEATVTLATTTTCGMETADRNGVRFQISNDGKYVLSTQPYYYYGAGAAVFLVRVADGRFVNLQHADSSYGRSFAPLRDSDFLLSQSQNADGGYGLYVTHIDTKRVFADLADKADMSSKVAGVSPYLLDSAYHSTNYPFIVPIIGGN
nr:conserved uncharacterized protein [uncultured bacterium]